MLEQHLRQHVRLVLFAVPHPRVVAVLLLACLPPPPLSHKQVPSTASTCNCALHINVTGPDMRLACPKGSYNITDFSWQLASRLRYQCWDGKHQQQLLDYLVSPANGLDKIDISSIARGDGSSGPAQQSQQKIWQSKGAIMAGAIVGAIVGVVLLTGLIWLVVGRKIMAHRKAQSFQKFQDDHTAAVAPTAEGAAASGSTQADPVARGTTGGGSAAM